MLEQLPGAHQLKQYSFKYNPPFDNSSLEETQVNYEKYPNVSMLLSARKLKTSVSRNRYTEIVLLLFLWRRNRLQ